MDMNSEIDIPGTSADGAEGVDGTRLEPCLETRNLSLRYAGNRRALNKVRLTVPRQRVTALIGPSGCGKTSLLRCFNRLNDLVDDCVITGRVRLEGKNIYSPKIDVTELRRRVGMVFQKPNPFPKSIYENVAFGLRIRGIGSRRRLDEIVQESLAAAALWDEVKDRLHRSALALSGGQQQRLVIARTLAVAPEVLLLDESASALDPISTLKIEELITELKKRYTIVIVTHNLQQAARVSDYTAFMDMGDLVEFDTTARIFTNPVKRRTEEYITGRYG